MRDKILSRLKEKFPGVNLSKKRLDEISDKLSKKITEESEIDGKLDELNDIMPFADIAKQDDRLRTLESKTKDKPTPQDPPSPQPKPVEDDDAPAWFKKHVEETNAKIAALETKNLQGTIQQRLAKDLKDIPVKYYAKRTLPVKEEDYDAFVEEIRTDYNEFRDEQVASGLMNATPPANGASGSTSAKQIDADIEAWAKANKTEPIKN